jgi:putative acetyltransferase
MEIKIRNEETKDIERVRSILRQAFPTDAESKLVDALRANGKAVISLVAVRGDDVLGYILFSPVSTTPPGESKGLGLAPVAVHSDFQGQGVGSQLIHAGLQRCLELGYDYCVVLGDPEYYQRFGFEKAGSLGLQNEYGVDDEFMIHLFHEDITPSGLVQYSAEFALFSV